MKRVLPGTRVLCEGMRGQNYWFNGCMGFLMECLGEDSRYDYWFFSGVTGDSFTQLFSRNPSVTAWCGSHNLFDHGFAALAFDACGYGFEYAKGITDANRNGYLPRIRECIDRGVPVLARGGKDTWEFCSIVGYDGDDLYYLICDKEEPTVLPNAFHDLVFVGERKHRPSLAEAHRQAVMRIPSIIAAAPRDGYSIGRQAFIDWADSFQNGSFEDVPEESLDVWRVHGTYLCMAGTNGCSRGFLKRALELNPDMAFINELEPLFAKHGDVFETLAYRDGGMQGGFGIKPAAIKDRKAMEPVSGKIMESAMICDDVLGVFAGL